MIRSLHEWYPVAAQIGGLLVWIAIVAVGTVVIFWLMVMYNVARKERDGE